MDREETSLYCIENFIENMEITREYCKSNGIADQHDVQKIQWLVGHHIRVHGMEGAPKELERLVSQSKRKVELSEANKPTYDPLQADLDLQHAVKQYAQAIQRVDELKLEMKEAQKELHEWHTKTINIINTQNHELQK